MRKVVGALLVLASCAGLATAEEIQVNNFKTLAVIYRGEPEADNYLADEQVAWIKEGFELGRRFYFLNSGARFNIVFDWMLFDREAPETAGPTYDNLEADMKKHGVKEGQYDGAIVTGRGLKGNWGGFDILNGTAACFGWGGIQGGLSWYPEDKPGVGYGAAWIFVHEFQHAVDLVAVPASDLDMLHAHPYTDRFDDFFEGYYQGGEHFDWIALTLREFDEWLGIKGVTNSVITVADQDGDGFPDADERLPMDEKRFGSSTSKVDSDDDGLNDLAEYMADRYRGSDPTKPDSDGDGVRDGRDRYPTVAITPELAYVAGGDFAALPTLIDSVWERNDAGGPCRVHGGWDEDAIYLRFVGPRKFSVDLKIDGSADSGYWQGGDTYMLRLSDDGAKYWGFGMDQREPLGVKTDGQSDGDQYVLDVTIPAKLGQGGSWPPNQPADGLTLTPGRTIGVNAHLVFASDSRALFTPHHTMFATRLTKPAHLPDQPRLLGLPVEEDLQPYLARLDEDEKRPVLITAAEQPIVEVIGVSPGRVVTITDGKQAYGSRIGSGRVRLFDLPKTGSDFIQLYAETKTQQSPPLHAMVKRSAMPPQVLEQTSEGSVFKVSPHGVVEVWWGLDDVPVAPLAGARADKDGRTTVDLSGDNLRDGWVVRGFLGTDFTDEVFIDAWPKIERHFKGGIADPRLPDDGFSFLFDGYLFVEEAGNYTFELECDDGGRVYVNGELVVNNWGTHGMRKRTGTVRLAEGPQHIEVRYYESAGWAGVKLRYAPPNGELTYDIPVRRLPLELSKVQLFAKQRDALGNVSAHETLKQATGAVAQRPD